MIDYGEDKQTYGVPQITVGPISQLLTAVYIGVFLFSFFLPEFAKTALPQINADLPQKFWTVFTGLFIFPESAGVYTGVPSGFWVVITFFFIFLVLRPLEEKSPSRTFLVFFLLLFMLGPALVLWGLYPGSFDPIGTWSFWMPASSGWALWKFRTLNLKLGEKRFPAKWFYLLLLLIPVIFSASKENWCRGGIYLACALLGVLWGVFEERKTTKNPQAEDAGDMK